MANISITTKCNQRCDYCFTKIVSEFQDKAVINMNKDLFKKSLEFLERSHISHVRLLGGEPTLHPYFTSIIDAVLCRKINLLIFTNGLMPKTALRKLERIEGDRVSVMVNITPAFKSLPALNKRLRNVFLSLGAKVTLGLNIYSPGVKYEHMLDLIYNYKLSNDIRLGLAHPCVYGTNDYLHPRHYPEVGRRLLGFAESAKLAKVNLKLDCGFVPCMFPEDNSEAFKEVLANTGKRCNPIIDVLPDGNVISCYPLARLHMEAIPAKEDATWLRGKFEDRLRFARSIKIYKKCGYCHWFADGFCSGGCLAASMMRLRQMRNSA